jgi:nucleotide-binding universal stress UspA family protein
MPSLMEAALAIAQRHHGEVVVMSVAEVPEGETLLAGRGPARALEPLLQRAARYAADRGVTAYPVVKISRRVSRAIVETASEEECNFLILGRAVADSLIERLVESIVERVLRDAPCQVGIVYGTIDPAAIKGVVVPVTRGSNPRLAAELAPAFAQRFAVPTRAVTVVPTELTNHEADQLVSEARETLAAAGMKQDLTVLRRREVAFGLTYAVQLGELVVIGAPSTGPVAALLGETVPTAIARRGRYPVIVVRDVEQKRARRFERIFFGRTQREAV